MKLFCLEYNRGSSYYGFLVVAESTEAVREVMRTRAHAQFADFRPLADEATAEDLADWAIAREGDLAYRLQRADDAKVKEVDSRYGEKLPARVVGVSTFRTHTLGRMEVEPL